MVDIGAETGKSNADLILGFDRSANSASSIQPISGVTTVRLLGASILYGISNGYEALMSKYLKHFYGLDVTIINDSLGGRDIDDVRAYFATIASGIQNDPSQLFVAHPFGNTITDNIPYEDLDQTTIDAISENLLGLQTDVEGNGNLFLMIETTCRDYDFATIQDELAGSLPFNRNILFDVVKQAVTPNFYNGRPYMTWYEFTRNWYHLIGTDGTHYDPIIGYGSAMLRYLCDMIGRRILGYEPLETKRDSEPKVNKAEFHSIMINPTDGESGVSTTAISANSLDMTSSAVDQDLVNQFGYGPSGITVSNTADVLSMVSNSYADGDITPTLDNDEIKNSVGFMQSATFADIFTLSGLEPGITIRVQFLVLRDTISDDRTTLFSLDGGTTTVEIYARDYFAYENTGELTIEVPESGQVTASIAVGSGSSAYWNGSIVDIYSS